MKTWKSLANIKSMLLNNKNKQKEKDQIKSRQNAFVFVDSISRILFETLMDGWQCART